MDPTCVFNFFYVFLKEYFVKSNCIIFIFSWCGTHTKIRSKLVVIVTAGSQKITLWGPQRIPLGILRVNFMSQRKRFWLGRNFYIRKNNFIWRGSIRCVLQRRTLRMTSSVLTLSFKRTDPLVCVNLLRRQTSYKLSHTIRNNRRAMLSKIIPLLHHNVPLLRLQQ